MWCGNNLAPQPTMTMLVGTSHSANWLNRSFPADIPVHLPKCDVKNAETVPLSQHYNTERVRASQLQQELQLVKFPANATKTPSTRD
jgi:hypothetical protein